MSIYHILNKITKNYKYCIDCNKKISIDTRTNKCHSCSHKNIYSKEFRRKRRLMYLGSKNPNYHNYWTKKQKRKASKKAKKNWRNPNYKGNSQEYRDKIKLAVLGKNNPNWNGKTNFFKDDYDQKIWTKKFRKMIALKNLYICNCCGEISMNGAPHHINYIRSDCREINLVWVCRSCNMIFNFERDYWFAYWCEKLHIKPETLL